MKRIDAKWLVRVLVLALILVAVAALLVGSAKLADVVAGLLIVGLAASWVVAWRSRKETIRFFPGIIALALFWSTGILALFAWLDTPPSTPAGQPAGFVPNGTGRIAFTERWDIYVMNADGTGETRLTGNKYGGIWPAWSPSGERLAFELQDEIYVMNADGTHQTRLTHNYQNRQCTPAWSPGGQHLAFVSRPSDGNPEIYIVAVDGTDPIYLTRDAWYPLKYTWRAAWSPDGEQLVFLGQDGIYVMSADGTNRTRLTDLGHPSSSCNNPVWSPDRQHIAFLSGLNGTNIYVIDVDGTNQTRITAYQSYPAPNHVTIQHFVWSPDGKHIAYDASVPTGLNRIDREGTNLIHLGSGDYPAWAP